MVYVTTYTYCTYMIRAWNSTYHMKAYIEKHDTKMFPDNSFKQELCKNELLKTKNTHYHKKEALL